MSGSTTANAKQKSESPTPNSTSLRQAATPPSPPGPSSLGGNTHTQAIKTRQRAGSKEHMLSPRSPTTKAIYQKNLDMWSRLEEEEEREFLAENSTVTTIESYLRINFPAAPEGFFDGINKLNNGSGSATQNGNNGAVSSSTSSLPGTARGGRNGAGNKGLPTICESGASIKEIWRDDLGFDFDFDKITESMVTNLVERVKQRPHIPLPNSFVWTLVNRVEEFYF